MRRVRKASGLAAVAVAVVAEGAVLAAPAATGNAKSNTH
jgi:hypothetical protein